MQFQYLKRPQPPPAYHAGDRAYMETERLITLAAKEVGLPAYASYATGGKPVLPSLVFHAVAAREVDAFHRGRPVTQSYKIIIRAESYREVIRLADDYHHAIHAVAGSKYAGTDGDLSDVYNSKLNYRSRIFGVSLRR